MNLLTCGRRLLTPQMLKAMKLTLVFLTAAFLHVSAKGFSQSITFSGKNIPLEKVFQEIKKQSDYVVFYDYDLVRQAKPVSLNVKNANIREVMDECLKNQPLTYSIENKTIIITKRPVTGSAEMSVTEILPLPVDVHGRVVNEKGEPIAGASIQVKGNKNKGTSTNENGEFTLTNVDANATLVISGTNIETFEIKVNNRTDLATLSAKIKIAEGEEITVKYNTGYQDIPKERATGSFSSISNELYNRRVSTDVISHLEGITPGLLFVKGVNSAFSTNGYNINIRGHSTLFSNDQPLIIVDNFPFDGNLSDLNPNDVENITILKDAAAASIWGVRSGNGVIVITTKRGKRNQKLYTEFNANFTIGNRPNLFYSNSFLNANDYINIEQKLFSLNYYNSTLSNSSLLVSPVVQILADQRSGAITAQDATNKINALRNLDVRNDLENYFYRKSVAQQYAVNFRGGGDKTDYYLSAGEDHLLSEQVGNDNNRLTFKSGFDFYPVKQLQISANINYTQSLMHNNASGLSASNMYPYMQLVDANGNPLSISTDLSLRYKQTKTNAGFLDWQYRPLEEIGLADNTTTDIDNLVNVGIKYTIYKDLFFETSYQYEHALVKVENYYSDSTYYTRNLINQYIITGSSGNKTYPIPIGGILQQGNAYLTSKQFRGMLNYNHDWDNIHSISALAGIEIRGIINEGDGNTAYGYDKSTGNSVSTIDYNTFYNINPIGSARIPNNQGFSKSTNNFLSYFMNAVYTYKKRYSVSASARLDYSNLFGLNTNQKAVPLYSVGGGWEIGKESFYHINWLPTLKIRATYGYTANINKTATAITTLKDATNASFTGVDFATIANPGNPDLRWEKVRTTNFGVDFSSHKNIISGSVEFYLKQGIDLFGTSPLAPSTGLQSFFGNTASTSGHGADILINSQNIKRGGFMWVSSFILDWAVDKVKKYEQQATTLSVVQNTGNIIPVPGSPVFSIYSFRWAGLSPSNGDPRGYVGGNPSTDYTTIVNMPIDSLQYNGPGRPTLFGALRNTISYKKFSLSFNIAYAFHYYFRKLSVSDATAITTRNGMGLGNQDYTKAWKQAGDELITNVPSIKFPPSNTNRSLFYQYSSILVDKGDNIRLQDISVDYDLGKPGKKSFPFQTIHLYGYFNNIGILWRANKDHIDPNVLYSSAITNYTQPRSIAFGIRAGF